MFIEFTVYNAQVNLFGIVTIVGEFLTSGGIEPQFRVEPYNLLAHYSDAMLFQIVCEIIYVLFVLSFIVKEIRNLWRQRKEYFKQIWNFIEISVIVLSVCGITIFFYRLVTTNALVKQFAQTHGDSYIKFQYVGYWNELLMYIVAWLVFLANIKFVRLLRFNKRMGMLSATLRNACRPLCMFFIMFAILFMAYAQFFHLIYYKELSSWKTMVHSMETCLQMMLGKFNYQAMEEVNSFLGLLFFVFYILTVAYILINMFLTILNESFYQVRCDISKQSNDYEIVDFMLQRFLSWTGLGGLVGGGDKDQYKTMSGDKANSFQLSVDDFPDKVERLVDIISKVYFTYDQFDTIFEPEKGVEKKKKIKSQTHHHSSTVSKKGMADIDV